MSHDIMVELARAPLLTGLPADVLRELADAGIMRRFRPGAVLWLEGGQPEGMFIVLEGEVVIVRGEGGAQHVVHRAGAGATIGEVPLLAGGGYPATALAATAARCFLLRLQVLHRTVALHPEVAWRLLAHLAGRIRFLVDRLDERSATTVRTRMARRLLERGADDDWFRLPGTQAALAEEIGTAREVVVRTLRELRRSGLLESDGRGRYRIPDRAALQAAIAPTAPST